VLWGTNPKINKGNAWVFRQGHENVKLNVKIDEYEYETWPYPDDHFEVHTGEFHQHLHDWNRQLRNLQAGIDEGGHAPEPVHYPAPPRRLKRYTPPGPFKGISAVARGGGGAAAAVAAGPLAPPLPQATVDRANARGGGGAAAGGGPYVIHAHPGSTVNIANNIANNIVGDVHGGTVQIGNHNNVMMINTWIDALAAELIPPRPTPATPASALTEVFRLSNEEAAHNFGLNKQKLRDVFETYPTVFEVIVGRGGGTSLLVLCHPCSHST
jgi:hypothetical protein